VLFAHRVNGLPGCWIAVMFNHPSAWVADRDGPAAISVPDRAANVCHPADATSVTRPTQRLSPSPHNGQEPGGNLVATTTRNGFQAAS
jgi:hypothetical protein